MAIRHGLAGQWARNQADRNLRNILSLYLMLVFVYGVCFGFFIARVRHWVGWAVVAAGAALVVLLYRLLDRPVRALSKQRIRYLRGAQVEGLVGWLLEDLPNGWHVFHGMKLVADWDIDHIVVRPRGLFCISTKAYRGLLACGPDARLTYNNEPTDLLRQTTGQALQLRDRLEAMLGSDVPFVQAVLAVPLAFADCPIRQGAVLVVHQEDLLPAIEENRAKLSASQVERCAKVLDMLQQSAAHLFRQSKRPSRPVAAPTQPAGDAK
jgi:hypothetical protein